MTKYFISHSSEDKKIVQLFVDLLVQGCSITKTDIFCSSLPGHGIPAGQNFVEYIKSELNGSAEVFFLLSKNYLKSTFCIAELGGCWATDKPCFIILLPDVTYTDIPTQYQHTQACNIKKGCDLDNLKDSINSNVPTAMWNKARENFLVELKEGIQTETKIMPVKQMAPISVQKSKISVEKAPKKEKSQTGDIVDNFENMKSEVERELNKYSRVVQLICYSHYSNEGCIHYRYLQENNYIIQSDISSALQSKYIEVSDDEFVYLNTNNIKIKNLIKKLDQFRDIMKEDEETLQDYVEEKYEVNFDLSNKDFWCECFDLHI